MKCSTSSAVAQLIEALRCKPDTLYIRTEDRYNNNKTTMNTQSINDDWRITVLVRISVPSY
jgi:hypothetical protein